MAGIDAQAFFLFFTFFVHFLKVTFNLQALQNIGYIHCVAQNIPEPILYPAICISHSPSPKLPSTQVTTGWLSVSLFACFYIHKFVVFFRLHIQVISYIDFLSLTYFT